MMAIVSRPQCVQFIPQRRHEYAKYIIVNILSAADLANLDARSQGISWYAIDELWANQFCW